MSASHPHRPPPSAWRRAGLWRILQGVALAASLGLGTFAFVVWRGLYDVSATAAHLQPVHDLLEVAMNRSVQARARDIRVPALQSPAMVSRGAACYRDACVQCHGGPGVAQQPFAMSLQPLPGPLLDAAMRWRPGELYWITRHGIKMSGMPAWATRLNDQDLWSLVAFLQQLPSMSPQAYQARMTTVAGQSCLSASSCSGTGRAACPPLGGEAVPVPGHDATRPQAPLLMRQYACNACHVIPGVVGSPSHVGPPLDGLWRRSLIAGRLPATQEALARWIRTPQQVDPQTAMPDMGVSEAHAREIAAWLMQAR